MACCGYADAVKLHENESEEAQRGTKNRKLKINTILTQIEKLKEDTETQTETEMETEETEKCKLRINKLLRQVNKLRKEESELEPKTSELRISNKGTVRLFMFGDPKAKLLYDRDSTGRDDDPILLHDLQVYSQLAINAYNKKHSTKYMLVEVVRAFRSLPSVSSIYALYLTFTAKLRDDEVAAKTFQTEMRFGNDGLSVLRVDSFDAPAISHLAT